MSNLPTKYKPRCCNECGLPYRPRREDEFFCSTTCRKTFDNRAMVRGRELYHLFMVMRYERRLAKAYGVWAIMCRLAKTWYEEDEAKRDGRKSWTPPTRQVQRYSIALRNKESATFYDGTGRDARR